MSFLRSTRAALIALACCATSALAELPTIYFERIQPLGVAAGSSTEVTIIGREVEDVPSLHFDHPGFSAELVKPKQFRITVSKEVPEGTYDVRLVGRFGVSNPRQFAVSHGLTDVTEKEPNQTAAEAQVVALNVAINGTSDANAQDVFRFAAKRGMRISLDCQAMRLESLLDATLIVTGPGGQILASNGDYHGRDPFIDFLVPADGEYDVIVHDLSYRGGHPYRLLITDRPHVENIFPRAVQPGQAVEFVALGRNLKSGKFAPASEGEPPLEEFRFTYTPPSDPATIGGYTFLEHPTDHSVLPTAATCTLSGLQFRVPVEGGALHPVNVVVAATPPSVEVEPNNDREQPQPIKLPAVISGRFDAPRDADWFEFETDEAGPYFFDVYSERIAGRADPYLVVVDENGNTVQELDDFGHRMNAFDGHLRDPAGSINLQGKKKYRVLVQDRYGRGGPRYQYVFAVRRPEPDFFIAAIHSQNPGPAGTNIWRGGTASLDLVIHQRDGFNGEIVVTAEDLPPGVHAAPVSVTNNNRGTIVLWADEDAPEFIGPIRLKAVGRQTPESAPVEREVRIYTRVWGLGGDGSSRPSRDLVIGVLDRAPYSLKIVPERITVEAGKKAELKLVATRLWPEFNGKITAIPLQFPGNFKVGTVEVPEGVSEIPLSIEVQENSRPGNYTLVFNGQAQVPYSKDPQGGSKQNTLVTMPCLPVTLSVTEKAK